MALIDDPEKTRAKLDALADYAAQVVAGAKLNLRSMTREPPINVRREEARAPEPWRDRYDRHGRPYSVEVHVSVVMPDNPNGTTGFPVFRAKMGRLTAFGPTEKWGVVVQLGRRSPGREAPEAKTLPSKAAVRRAVLEAVEPYLPRVGARADPREVAAFVAAQSYMDLERSERSEPGEVPGTHLRFATRQHGSVGDGRPGREDVLHARELKRALHAEYGRRVRVAVDTVDEWTDLTVEV